LIRKSYLKTIITITLMLCACYGTHASNTLTLSLESPKLEESSNAKTQPAKKSSDKPAAKQNTVKVGRVGVVTTAAAIYHSKSSSSAKYADVKADTPLAIVREEDGWYGVLMSNGKIGWIKTIFVDETGYDLVAKKPLNRSLGTSRGGYTRNTDWLDELVKTASQTSVARYLYGGTNPSSGMDCSAFVQMIFRQYNINLPRTSRQQAQVGQSVPFDQLQPGDRLYFACRNPYIDHCGIYTGNGYFVHCSATRNGVGIDSLASDFFWRSLVVAKRS